MGEVAIIGVDLAIRLFRYRSRLNRISNETLTWLNQFNDLVYGERSLPVPSPLPLAPAKAFSRSGCGRIFSLYSRVMQVGLLTGPAARRPRSGLSRPIFSGPHDCSDLVMILQGSVIVAVYGV